VGRLFSAWDRDVAVLAASTSSPLPGVSRDSVVPADQVQTGIFMLVLD